MVECNRAPDAANEPRGNATNAAPPRSTLHSTAERIAKSLKLLEQSWASLHLSEQLLTELGGDEELREALIRRSQGLRAQLRAAVTVHARRMRAENMPPQEMLVSTKAAVGDAARAALPSREAEEIVSQSARWAIDAYYSAA